MIFFNFAAAGFAILGLTIGYGIQSFTGQVGNSNILAASIALCAMILFDGAFRWHEMRQDPHGSASYLFLPSRGGQVMFLPVWLVASIMFVHSLFEHQAAS